MKELKGFEETSGVRRPHGAPPCYQPGRKTWRRPREQDARELGATRQPYCVIVGADHCGLPLAARLKQLGVSTLIIDQHERPSDAWRDRHETLSLHSPSWLDAHRTLIDIDVGSGTSAHDISAEFWEAGADVTMIQRSPTIVMRHDSLVTSLASLYGDEARARGVTPETEDLLFASVPLRVLLQTQQQLVADINRYMNGHGRQASSSLLVRTTPVSGRSYCAILPAITLMSVPLS
jgi:cation diffusion facilitator CzcD-associated flavoprotein CzcO